MGLCVGASKSEEIDAAGDGQSTRVPAVPLDGMGSFVPHSVNQQLRKE